jgi:hypothetical protein
MIPAAPRQRVCTVSIRTGPGAPYFSHTTMASKVFGAVAKAKEFFEDDFWKGRKPTPETVYRVYLVADERVFRVRDQVLETWKEATPIAVPESGEALARQTTIAPELLW